MHECDSVPFKSVRALQAPPSWRGGSQPSQRGGSPALEGPAHPRPPRTRLDWLTPARPVSTHPEPDWTGPDQSGPRSGTRSCPRSGHRSHPVRSGAVTGPVTGPEGPIHARPPRTRLDWPAPARPISARPEPGWTCPDRTADRSGPDRTAPRRSPVCLTVRSALDQESLAPRPLAPSASRPAPGRAGWERAWKGPRARNLPIALAKGEGSSPRMRPARPAQWPGEVGPATRGADSSARRRWPSRGGGPLARETPPVAGPPPRGELPGGARRLGARARHAPGPAAGSNCQTAAAHPTRAPASRPKTNESAQI